MGNHGNAGIDKTKYDFVADSGGIKIPANMHPDAAKTICKAEYYCWSLDTARTALLLQPRKPEFPFLLWNDLLWNQFVDLNKVFSHLHAPTETAKLSERIGDHISLVTTTLSRLLAEYLPRKSGLLVNGATRGQLIDVQLSLFSTTKATNLTTGVPSSRKRLAPQTSLATAWSLKWKQPCAALFLTISPAASGTISRLCTSTMRIWALMGCARPTTRPTSARLRGSFPARLRRNTQLKVHPAKSVVASIRVGWKCAAVATAFMSIGALNAKEIMEHIPAPKRQRVDREHGVASRVANKHLGDQAFRRGFLWRDGEASDSPSADSTIHAAAFPNVPDHKLQNSVALETIRTNPHLFKIVTPFNVNRFEELLKTHLNRPLVESACRGLREGFWPHANTSSFIPFDPEIVPNHRMGDRKLSFLKLQRDKEVSAGRFSPSFTSLSPGMQSSALGAVPKANSDKLRLITDQSIGQFSLNSFIDKTDVKVHYDNLTDLGRSLRAFKGKYGEDVPLVLWKSDVAHAFQCIPMHPLWQARQVVEINGLFHVNRCMVFGSRASPVIWCKIAGLIAWITTRVRRLLFLHHYMDDYWSIKRGIFPVPYGKYGDLRPHSQVQFLTLLNKLGVPHESSKQVFGECIAVIGFEVDTRAMTIRMGDHDRRDLAAAILAFLNAPKRSQPLRKWQCILGWMNWALNAMPHARPSLSSAYRKIAGKTAAHAPVFLNAEVKLNFCWFVDWLVLGSGLSLIWGNNWDPAEANVTIYCDACPSRMGFWSPSHWKSFYYCCPPEFAKNSNFCEAATIVLALQWALLLDLPDNPRILIYSDNLAAVEVFSSMRGNPPYFEMTIQAAAWVHDFGLLWRTLHVPGLNNQIADYLSRGMLDQVRASKSTLPIYEFTPLASIYPGPTSPRI